MLAIALALLGPWLLARPEATTELQASLDAHPCSPEALARADGLEIGTTLAEEWRLAAIRCSDEDVCTQLVLSRAEGGLTLRLCPHVEGGPLPPLFHEGLDLFFDSPHPRLRRCPSR